MYTPLITIECTLLILFGHSSNAASAMISTIIRIIIISSEFRSNSSVVEASCTCNELFLTAEGRIHKNLLLTATSPKSRLVVVIKVAEVLLLLHGHKQNK